MAIIVNKTAAGKIPMTAFFYHPENRTFSQEISSLGRYDLFQRIYDDACDTGFTMVSKKTGKEVVFFLSKDIDWAGDEGKWIFEPIPESIRKVPAAKGLKVIIFND